MTKNVWLASWLGLVTIGASGCPAPKRKNTLPKDWQEQRTVTCSGTSRPVLACPRVFQVDVATTAEKKSFFDFASPIASEKEAASRLNAAVTGYSIAANQLCEQYNACLMDASTFMARSDDLRDRLGKAFEIRPALEQAARSGDTLARKKTLLAAYKSLVIGAEDQGLTIQFDVEASLPVTPGAVEDALACKPPVPALTQQRSVKPGEVLVTGTRVGFRVVVNRPAYVYLMQRNEATGEITPLFPDPKISMQNPLQPGTPLRIPDAGQNYCLNNKDIGVERVMVVASLEPLAQLASALANVSDVGDEGGATPLRELSQIRLKPDAADGSAPAPCNTRALELEQSDAPPPKATCSRSRGLVLEGESLEGGMGASSSSFIATTEAADTIIAKAFPFDHVTTAEYKSRSGVPSAPLLSRGIAMEE